MQENSRGTILLLWSHLGLNQGPPDYESGATNQLSYGTSRACATLFGLRNYVLHPEVLFLLFALTGITVEHEALVFGNPHLLLGQLRDREHDTCFQ